MVGGGSGRWNNKQANVGQGHQMQVVGKGSCNVNVVEALERCSPAPHYGDSQFHTGFVEIRDPGWGHPLHAYIHQRGGGSWWKTN
mmetsp:Transcript_18570/g.28866  ORF Transcript_18570/g.28866 Transcript_18570/m.28866 type:complete len:85 (+) Transcript_18570:14-268(+)